MTSQAATQTSPAGQTQGEDKQTDPASFEIIARTLFAPVYPLVAQQIIEETGITCGFCLDIGCGGGHLGMALARLGHFDMGFLDPSEGMREIVAQNTVEAGIALKSRIFEGSAESIPLPDNSVDLVVSRGSIFFWTDQTAAFREIERVLKPGGKAYIGGGFGSAAIREEIIEKMKKRKKEGAPSFGKTVAERLGPEASETFREKLNGAHIQHFTISQSTGKGLWITICKGETHGSM